MLRMLGRIVLVPLGFLLAVLAALAVLVTLGLEITTRTISAASSDPDRIEVLLDLGAGILRLLAAATIVPALLVLIVGEVARIRSVLYYVLGGGLALGLLPLFARLGAVTDGGNIPVRVWTVSATAGFAGGLVYWLVAGRRA